MDLTPYVDSLRNELAVAADVGGAEARSLAARLTAPLDSATRLVLLGALSAAMAEVTRDLAPGSVDMRLRGLDPEFVVTAPSAREAYADPRAPERKPSGAPAPPTAAPMAPAHGEDGGTARINFRLPAHLKSRVEETAAYEGLSVNAWLVRAVAGSFEPEATRDGAPGGPTRDRGRRRYTGWVR
ncbi:hypothetical protein OG948_46005 (plasmid) [Embleya sp. NBC_00888]|uniref:hypothetical protein n=1 Tax=Embleya sp. NBC_00888 TaxID=2975960 RepID=UPI002F90C5DC|nr:hypothetical protein OG948_46005 [Embleya sp. NBC_00888]